MFCRESLTSAEINVLSHLSAAASGDPLELPEEAPCEEQTRGVLQEPVPDLPGVRREPAETRAVRLPESGQSGERPGESHAPVPPHVFTWIHSFIRSKTRDNLHFNLN